MKIKLNLSGKIMLLVFCVLALSIAGIATISITQTEKHLVNLAKVDLAHLASMAQGMCEVHATGSEGDGEVGNIEQLAANILAQKVGKTGYIYAIDNKGTLIVHPAKTGANVGKYDFIQEIIRKGPKLADGEIGWITYPWINKELGETEPRDKIVAYTYIPEYDWVIAAGSYLDEFTAPVATVRDAIIIFGLIALTLSLGIAFMLSRTITKPVHELVEVAGRVTEGDVTQTVSVRTNDEVGELGHSFNNMIEYLHEAATAANRIADNDLTVVVEPRSDKDTFGISLKKMASNLTVMIKGLTDNSHELLSASTEIASTSEEMARGANEQSVQVDQIASAVEEMSVSIQQATENAGMATDTSKSAADNADEGGNIVSETIEGMQRITEQVRESANSIGALAKSAEKIGEIITVIDDIADQTNLLALNAAIEAARAGEQGRGFAVVADEVRKLAERTGTATGEISAMIKSVQTQTGDAVHSMEVGIEHVETGQALADKAGHALTEIVTMSQQVMQMVREIASASNQQSTATDQITNNVKHIATVIKESAEGSGQVAAAAEELNRQAEAMNKTVEVFKIK